MLFGIIFSIMNISDFEQPAPHQILPFSLLNGLYTILMPDDTRVELIIGISLFGLILFIQITNCPVN